jgi:DUF218 domain
MPKLIACLGYDLRTDGSIQLTLINRLNDVARLCKEYKHSTVVLLGGSSYRNTDNGLPSQAFVMKEYLQNNYKKELADIEILTEENSTSTVEQLCHLKERIVSEKPNLSYESLVIVSSEFFNERVKLYAEYIFGDTKGVLFVGSPVPPNLRDNFQTIEKDKLSKAQEWLKRYQKGDSAQILMDQRNFQAKVINDKIDHPIS